MGKSNVISGRDVLRLVRIVDQLRELPADAIVRQTHLVTALSRLVNAQVGILSMGDGFEKGGNPTYGSVVDNGGFEPRALSLFLQYLRDDHAADPMLRPMIGQRGRLVTRLRRQVVSDRDWYRSRHVGEYRQAGRMDDCIYSFARTNGKGRIRGIGAHRQRGDPQRFTHRDRFLVHVTQKLLDQRPELLEPRLSLRQLAITLPPRHQRVLRKVLEGLAEKEIAKRLDLSVHTVHGYMKDLYLAFNVQSRPELMAMWIDPTF